VQQLESTGANLEATAIHESSPLHLAAAAGRHEVVQVLLLAGANHAATASHGHDGSTTLQIAAVQGYCCVVRQLLAAGAQLEATDALGMTPLFQAASAGQHEVVQVLLAAGANMEAHVEKVLLPYTWLQQRASTKLCRCY
jgi:ankyrin repeat protein